MQYSQPVKKTVIKELEEIDESIKVRKIFKEIEENRIKRAPTFEKLKGI